MADNVTVDNNALPDYVVASDDDGTAEHQYVKVEFGPDNTQTKVTASVGLPINPVQETAGIGIGAAADAEAAANGSVIAVLKRLRTLLAGGLPAALSGNGALKVEQVVAGPTQPVSGTVTANAGSGTFTIAGAVTNAGTFAVQDSEKVADNAGFTDGTTKVQPSGFIFDEVAGTALTENDAAAARIDAKRAQVGVIEDATTRGQRMAVSAAGAAKVDGSAVTQPVSGTVTANAGSGTFATKEGRAATSALTTVADNAASTSILAANANRLKAVITNDSSARLYLRFEAAAASTTNYMVSLAQNETWEENLYTGEIRGIWASDPNDGAARVTEFTT